NYYNGGGVALGDLTGDGLPEIVLTSNLGGTRLYLNEGKFRFRDVTAEAGLHSRGWTTGVTLADLNGDGLLDIYVCHAGLDPKLRANELYINQGLDAHGVPTFVEQAAAYGVADSGYSTQAVFFDYDRDGWPDIYVANDFFERDYLYINQGDGTFSERLEQEMPYISLSSMGLDIADVTNDGWPDVYVVDMLPDDERRLKTTTSFENWH